MCISQDHAALNGTICKRSAIWFKYFDVIIYLLTSCWTLLLQKIYLSTSGTCTTSLFYFIFLYPFIFLYILFTTTLKDRPQRATSSTLVSWFTPRNHFRFVHGTAVKSTCCGNSRPAVPPKRVSQTLGTFRWNGALQHITTGLCSTSQQGFAAHRRLCSTPQALQHIATPNTHRVTTWHRWTKNGSYAQCKSGQDRSIATEDQRTPTEEQAQHRTKNTHPATTTTCRGASPQTGSEHKHTHTEEQA